MAEKPFKEPKNVAEAMANVMAAVPYVQKTKSSGLGFAYASEAGLIEALHDAMVSNGLVLNPTDMQLLSEDSYQTASKKTMFRARIRVGYLLAHGPSGTSVAVCALGEAASPDDKVLNKAMTGAYKYALRQSFLIETGDDPDKYQDTEAGDDQSPKPDKKDSEKLQWQTRGTKAIADCKTIADLKAFAEKLKSCKFEDVVSELTVMAERRQAELEK